MSYFREFVAQWRAFAAACCGLVGGTVSIYINNIFSPYLIDAFGWSRADFALIGLTVVISVICLPIVGRLTDRFGMKKVALVGVAALPLIFVGLSLQQGSFLVFFILSLLQMLVVSALAGFVVYSRLIVRSFTHARGLALGLASCAAPLATVVCAPLLSSFIDAFDWRAGYLLMAAISGAFGAAALLLIPPHYQDRETQAADQSSAAADYGFLFRSRPFLVIFMALLLCNLHFTMQTTQLKLILEEIGIASTTGSLLISVFAVGVIIGRIACGFSLDRFAPNRVATICFLVPSLGLATLAAGSPNVALIALAVGSLGFSVGAEADIAAFLAAKYFSASLFSSVLGLFAGAMAASAFVGALLLSWTVEVSSGYSLFLGLTAATMFVGSLSFLLLPRTDHAAA